MTQAALVFVVHHVLTDGIGGLAVLEALAGAEDGRGCWDDRHERETPYSALALTIDAVKSRLDGLARLPAALRTAARGASELRLLVRTRAARSSLNRPTGP